jgi:hypothetical protein
LQSFFSFTSGPEEQFSADRAGAELARHCAGCRRAARPACRREGGVSGGALSETKRDKQASPMPVRSPSSTALPCRLARASISGLPCGSGDELVSLGFRAIIRACAPKNRAFKISPLSLSQNWWCSPPKIGTGRGRVCVSTPTQWLGLDAAAVCAFDAAPWPAKYSVQRKRLAIGDPGSRSCPDPLGATQALRSLRKRAICRDPGQQGGWEWGWGGN